MQHFILALALMFSSLIAAQGDSTSKAAGSNLKVSVINVLNNNGEVRFALYTKENFMKQPFKAASSKIVDGKSTVIFTDVPEGHYAILCFHDENNNGKMDFDLNGMPIESYGNSNNIYNYGPPQFELSKFEVLKSNVSLEIKF